MTEKNNVFPGLNDCWHSFNREVLVPQGLHKHDKVLKSIFSAGFMSATSSLTTLYTSDMNQEERQQVYDTIKKEFSDFTHEHSTAK